jgi:hypothetical protein
LTDEDISSILPKPEVTSNPRVESEHMTDTIHILRAMVRGAYDLQQLRMQSGLRLCANFRAKLGVPEGEEEETEEAEAKKESAIKLIKAEYRRLTDGITSEKGRVMMAKLDFTGSAIISSQAEYALVGSYVALESQEARQFRDLTGTLEEIPIYSQYLVGVTGIGPAMAGVIIAYLDPAKARHVSSFWKYAGLDVSNGTGRSRREEHLVQREYLDRNGETKTRLGVTYNPFLKTKLMGVLGPSFLRSGSEWRKAYDDYKHRLETDPAREKLTVAAWKKRFRAGDENIRKTWTPGRIHTAATRYMVKAFLQDLWVKWRTLEGLEVTVPYSEAKLGMPPHGGMPTEESNPQPNSAPQMVSNP